MISSLTRLMVIKPIEKKMIVSCDSDVSRANSDSLSHGGHGSHGSHVGHISHVGVGSGSVVPALCPKGIKISASLLGLQSCFQSQCPPGLDLPYVLVVC